MKRVSSLILVMLVWVLVSPTLTRADAAPPQPPIGANIYPGSAATQVRMLAETVMISITNHAPGGKPSAQIRTEYTMRNLGSQDENQPVRFPLNFQFPHNQLDWEMCQYPLGYPEINDFSAQVDGQPAQVSTTTQKIADPSGRKGSKQVACWADFPVAFPAGQDVKIEVSYSVSGYPGVYAVDTYVEFNFALMTGKAWNGSIGSADIILQAPYPLSRQTLLSSNPADGFVQGSEIRWHYADLEPDRSIQVVLMDPVLAQRIAQVTKNVTDHPQNADAWGSLGSAYRDAVLLPAGWRRDETGYEMFSRSVTAFAKATALKPEDADLHFGYAELLCWNALYPSFGRPQDIAAGLVHGVEEIKRALEINPNHPRARALLQTLAKWPNAPRKIVDLSGSRPVYLILTPGVTYTPIPTRTRTPFPPSLTPSPTWTSRPTRTLTITPTVPSTITASNTPFPTQVAPAEVTATPQKPGGGSQCGSALFPGVALVFFAAQKGRRKAVADQSSANHPN